MIDEIVNTILMFLLLAGVSNLILSYFLKDWFLLISGTIYLILSLKGIVEVQKSKEN